MSFLREQLFGINFWLSKDIFIWQHRVPLVETRRMNYNLTLTDNDEYE